MKPSVNHVALIAFVLIAMVSFAQAYVFIAPNAKSPDQDGHCYDSSLNITFPINEVLQRPEQCETMVCGSDYSIQIMGCGVISVGPGMVLTKTDYSKPYPQCCPHVEMTEENVIES